MNIDSTLNRILNPVEKNGELIGAGLVLLNTGIDNIAGSVQRIVAGQAHLPNISNLITGLMGDQNFKTYAGAAVVGYLLKDATGIGVISKAGEIAQKIGMGGAMATVATDVLYYSTHANEGCDKAGFVKPSQSRMSTPSLQTRSVMA